jgi:integrase
MYKTVWIFQYKGHVDKRGDKASWYVGWYDFNGKRRAESCGPGSRGRNLAEKRQRQIQSELDTGTHRPPAKKQWNAFVEEYDEQILANLAVRSRIESKQSLEIFKEIAKPGYVEGIQVQTIDRFVAKRRLNKGKKANSTVSVATINKDLRHLKAALRIANEWGYLKEVPRIRLLREPTRISHFVTPEHFGAIYSKAAEMAKLPSSRSQQFSAAEWWKALLVIAYMTGLRINEILSLKWNDVNLAGNSAVTRADDNKGKRDERLALHAVVVEHLKPLKGAAPLLFPWPHDIRTLWDEFGRIQREAGIKLHCSGKHEHTPSCFVYGFHDLRRAFATVNAPRMKPEVLQKLMRHKSYQTTLGYVNLTSQVDNAVLNMPVPDVLKHSTVERQPPESDPQ